MQGFTKEQLESDADRFAAREVMILAPKFQAYVVSLQKDAGQSRAKSEQVHFSKAAIKAQMTHELRSFFKTVKGAAQSGTSGDEDPRTQEKEAVWRELIHDPPPPPPPVEKVDDGGAQFLSGQISAAEKLAQKTQHANSVFFNPFQGKNPIAQGQQWLGYTFHTWWCTLGRPGMHWGESMGMHRHEFYILHQTYCRGYGNLETH